jgi:hypothetical protein
MHNAHDEYLYDSWHFGTMIGKSITLDRSDIYLNFCFFTNSFCHELTKWPDSDNIKSS